MFALGYFCGIFVTFKVEFRERKPVFYVTSGERYDTVKVDVDVYVGNLNRYVSPFFFFLFEEHTNMHSNALSSVINLAPVPRSLKTTTTKKPTNTILI